MPAKPSRKPRRRNGIAAALRSFKPKIVEPRKGNKAYKRKTKHPAEAE
jgi:stalled ribosome alternative rescue factor ArfA